MRVTGRTTAPWRRPALAPVYGAVVAFGAVWLASLVVPAHVQVVVTARGEVSAQAADGSDDVPLVGGAVTITDSAGYERQRGNLDDTGGLALPPLEYGQTVCLTPPAAWTVTDPRSSQSANRWCKQVTNPPTDVVFELEAS